MQRLLLRRVEGCVHTVQLCIIAFNIYLHWKLHCVKYTAVHWRLRCLTENVSPAKEGWVCLVRFPNCHECPEASGLVNLTRVCLAVCSMQCRLLMKSSQIFQFLVWLWFGEVVKPLISNEIQSHPDPHWSPSEIQEPGNPLTLVRGALLLALLTNIEIELGNFHWPLQSHSITRNPMTAILFETIISRQIKIVTVPLSFRSITWNPMKQRGVSLVSQAREFNPIMVAVFRSWVCTSQGPQPLLW